MGHDLAMGTAVALTFVMRRLRVVLPNEVAGVVVILIGVALVLVATQRLGLQPAEAWATIYGSYPQIQVGLLATDVPQARRILASADWALLQERLFGYVKNYSHKIVPVRTGFQF